MRFRYPALLLLGSLLFPLPLMAGACTYSEAIMALERGNTVRGMALLRMASRDGDPRATRRLAALATEGDRREARHALAAAGAAPRR